MNSEVNSNALLDVKSLKKYFPIQTGLFKRTSGYVRAVDNVSLSIEEGETLGLVGESGCGKTTFGRCVLRAIEPTEGEVNFRRGDNTVVDITKLDKVELKELRKEVQMIFQDPYSSLDPRMTVLNIVGEPIRSNRIASGKALEDRVKELMSVVGLEVKHLRRYPHAFSGGQRQRIGIARALAANPKLIVADEPVSALDVSVQAQILNLLQDLQAEYNLTFLFVAHDLSVIEHISDRVAVMYVGKIVEMADTKELFSSPKHPYTEALLSAAPQPDPEQKMNRIILPGEVANPANPPSGCYFHPRCLYCKDICRQKTPVWEGITPGHFAACHFSKELELRGD